MLNPTSENGSSERSTVGVAIDKDKGSQQALKWAIDNVLNPGESITLIHVKQRFSSIPASSRSKVVNEEVGRELFRPFQCFCTRKHIKCHEILLEDTNIQQAIIECMKTNLFETLVLSASTRSGLIRRLRGGSDIPTSVMKNAPDFTTVCVISKGKVLYMRSATRELPTPAPSLVPSSTFNSVSVEYQNQQPSSPTLTSASSYSHNYSNFGSTSQGDRPSSVSSFNSLDDDFFKSPFTRGKAADGTLYGDVSTPEFDISFVGSTPKHLDHSRTAETMFLLNNGARPSSNKMDFGSFNSDRRTSIDLISIPESLASCDNFSTPSLNLDDVENKMRKLQLELKQTIDMYNAAFNEVLTSKQKEKEVQMSKMEEHKKIGKVAKSEEEALVIAEKEKQKQRSQAERAVVAAQKLAEVEAQIRKNAAEVMEEKRKAVNTLTIGGPMDSKVVR